MSTKRDSAAIVGVGAVACAACCAGPLIGFFGALGLLAGVALFGIISLAVAVVASFIVVRRRRRQAQACATATSPSVNVEIIPARNRS
ncbi:MAG: hypothetical protein ACXVH5_07480 [Ilumatobacteraceae bacterium]